MLRLFEDKLEVIDSIKMQPVPVCCLPSTPKFEHAMPQSPDECAGVSLVKSEFLMSSNIKDGGDAEVCVGGHSPDASIPAFGNMKMLTSEACHKNYVIFDHCEGKNTVIFHPSWLPESCFTSADAKYFVSGLHICNCKPIEVKHDFCSSAARCTTGLEVPVYSEVMLWQMASSNKARCSLGHPNNLKKDIMNAAGFLSDVEEESHDEFHENTEEIDALLSSDDELSSTGHSPSVASSNYLSETKNGYGDEIVGKKRKFQYSTLDEVDDDASSGPCKLAPDHSSVSSRCGSFEGGDHRDETSKLYNMEGTNCKGNDVFAEQDECVWGQSSGTFEGVSSDNIKRIKIKHNVQLLKNVVLGGDCLHAAGMLGQTIQYVKFLQSRLRDLGAAGDFHIPNNEPARPR